MKTSQRQSQSGFLLLDFIFAIVLGSGFAALVFAISYGFTMVESAQYIAFATARTYMGSHLDQETQAELGQQKFRQLTQGYLSTIAQGNWFQIVGEPELRDFGDDYNYSEGSYPGNSSRFEGARMRIQLSLLAFNWGILGSGGTEDEFQTNMTAFLGRQPSLQESREFHEQRYQQILRVSPRFSEANVSDYVVIMDNG